MPTNDMPKIWVDEEEQYDPITGEIIPSNTQALMPIEETEEIPLPTIAEQKDIVQNAKVDNEHKGMLAALVEMNNVAQVMSQLYTNETKEMRQTVLNGWCENFIQSRMRNNATAELLKARLLERLLNNIDNLDLDTSSRIYSDLSDVSSVDAQQALSVITGGGAGGVNSQQGGISLTINNATSDGATITNNTLNANPQQVTQLKEVATLNSSIKAWNNIPLPKKKPIDVEYIESKKD